MEDKVCIEPASLSHAKRVLYDSANWQLENSVYNCYLCCTSLTHLSSHSQDKTRQDTSEKWMRALAPLYPYPCYTLN